VSPYIYRYMTASTHETDYGFEEDARVLLECVTNKLEGCEQCSLPDELVDSQARDYRCYLAALSD
jgi:hypothetical protein